MKVAVVILNWNTKDYLRRFLPEVIASTMTVPGGAEVVVADSGSTDGSMEMMATSFPGVRTLPLGGNFGFTGGYNRALAQIDADYAVLLNSDVEVTPLWLSPLVEWMDTHPGCGACGPKLHGFDERDRFEYAGAAGGRIDRYGYPFCRGRVLSRLEQDRGQYDAAPKDVLWITGACLMVRMTLWRELGGLDERFFAHMEEIDLCWRMQLADWRVTVVPASTIYHIGGGTLPQGSPRKLELNYRNNLLLLENNLARTLALGMDPEQAVRKAARRIFWRQILDGLSAAAYLLSLRPKAFSAVLKAHSGYRKLRKRETAETIAAWRAALPKDHQIQIKGIYNGRMIPLALLRGRGVFQALEKRTDL